MRTGRGRETGNRATGHKDGMTAETKRYRCYWCGAKVYTRDERMPPSGRRGYLCWVSETAVPRGRVRALLCRACHESIGLGADEPVEAQGVRHVLD
jgi:hypothetical protein